MSEITLAPLSTQLGNEICVVEDTEKVFWLRRSDDYQSRLQLGNALAAQYRFKEAVEVYESALRIRRDDWKLFYSLSGANLTLRRFDEAVSGYHRCLELGADKKTIAYPLGIAAYLQKNYSEAAERFAQCLPSGDEMAIAVIYWHTLSCLRAGCKATLLSQYHADMKVGHHTAYRLAVSVFCGDVLCEQALSEIESETGDLNYVIALYGLCVFLDTHGDNALSLRYTKMLLEHDSAWPCVSYLAAWNDCYTEIKH